MKFETNPLLLRRAVSALLAMFRLSKLPVRTDAEAIASDWRAVGDDLRQAMTTFESESENA